MVGVDYRGFEADDTTAIWRYMSIERFEYLLGGYLYFAAAQEFGDPFEGAITEAEQARRRADTIRVFDDDDASAEAHLSSLSLAFEDLRRMTKINCWHASATESVAMWERYLGGGHGVAIRSTVGALKGALGKFRLHATYGEEPIVVGRVRYIDFAADEMVDRSTLGIFLHKRVEYRDEREIRALLSLRMASEFGVPIPDAGVPVGVDSDALIDEVRVGTGVDQSIIEDLIETMKRRSMRATVASSALAAKPVY